MKKKMNKKMKIIELLNRIANREEVPKKIIFLNEILEYDVDCQDYKGFSRTGSGAFLGYLFTNEPTQNFINDRVEILEDNTEELGKLNELYEKLYEKYMNQQKEIEEMREELQMYVDTNVMKEKLENEIEELKKENIELSNQITDGFWENDRLKNEIEKQQKEIKMLKKQQQDVKNRIEYYLVGNVSLDNFEIRNKELRKIEKMLEK